MMPTCYEIDTKKMVISRISALEEVAHGFIMVNGYFAPKLTNRYIRVATQEEAMKHFNRCVERKIKEHVRKIKKLERIKEYYEQLELKND